MTESNFTQDECRELEMVGFRPMIPGLSFFRGAEIPVENMLFRSKITVEHFPRGYYAFQAVSIYRQADRELFCEKTKSVTRRTFSELLAWLGPFVSRQDSQPEMPAGEQGNA